MASFAGLGARTVDGGKVRGRVGGFRIRCPILDRQEEGQCQQRANDQGDFGVVAACRRSVHPALHNTNPNPLVERFCGSHGTPALCQERSGAVWRPYSAETRRGHPATERSPDALGAGLDTHLDLTRSDPRLRWSLGVLLVESTLPGSKYVAS